MFVIFCLFGLALRPHLTPENVTSVGGCASIVPGLTTTLRNSSKNLWNHKTTHRFSCDSNVQCLFFFSVLRTSWIGSVIKLMRQTHFPSVCRELISTTEACNSGNGRRRPHPNVDLRSHSLPRQALILVPLPKNSSQVQVYVHIC